MSIHPSVGLPACLRACARHTEQQRDERWMDGCVEGKVLGDRGSERPGARTPACPHASASNHLPSHLPTRLHAHTRDTEGRRCRRAVGERLSLTQRPSPPPTQRTLTIFSTSFLRATYFSCLTSRYTHHASQASASAARRLSPRVLIERVCAASGAARSLSGEAGDTETPWRQFWVQRAPSACGSAERRHGAQSRQLQPDTDTDTQRDSSRPRAVAHAWAPPPEVR